VDQLPLDTVCTVLVRQSTRSQAGRYLDSAEVNRDVLVQVARRRGFTDSQIRLVEDDMGIGAYSTTIEERPGLSRWLFEELPSGTSRVLLVSHEDRLFRDQHETEHNRFIAQADKHGGWAICGESVYNFRRRFDQDRFRWACRASREYVEGHIKARLHPANQRNAMRGRYPGGQIHVGYIVNYDPRSANYKHYQRYEPHAFLVAEHLFRYFAQLPRPSLVEVVRHWERLVWPFFGPEVDPRVVKAAGGNRVRDEVLGGYCVDWRQVQNILTDVTYLGYRVRRGECAADESGQPLLCHPPLVDGELFWWCFDRLVAERPSWPGIPPRTTAVAPVARTRRPKGEPHRATAATTRFLAHGRVRCAVHGRAYVVRWDAHHGVQVGCNTPGKRYPFRSDGACPTFRPEPVEQAISEAFVEQLVLDERDLAELARLIDQRACTQTGEREEQMRRELTEARARLQRALEQSLREENAPLAEELLAHAREAKALIAAREADLAVLAASQPISSRAWVLTQRVEWVAQRIRATFLEWSREAQARVIGLALVDSALGYVNRWVLGLWMQWQGGAQSRREVTVQLGKRHPWTAEEKAALTRYYPTLTWDALCQMFPNRSQSGIATYARELGAHRGSGPFMDAVPVVFAEGATANAMASYGFPLAQSEERESPVLISASRSPVGRTRG
jgi:hypothetical protein